MPISSTCRNKTTYLQSTTQCGNFVPSGNFHTLSRFSHGHKACNLTAVCRVDSLLTTLPNEATFVATWVLGRPKKSWWSQRESSSHFKIVHPLSNTAQTTPPSILWIHASTINSPFSRCSLTMGEEMRLCKLLDCVDHDHTNIDHSELRMYATYHVGCYLTDR